MLAEIITVQSSDADCHADFTSAGEPITHFNIESVSVLVRITPLEGASQQLAAAFLRACFLPHCHYSLLARHHGECQMYNSMIKEMYWPHMTYDVYTTVLDCRYRAQNCARGKLKRQLELFSSEWSLEYIDMDMLEPLQRTK